MHREQVKCRRAMLSHRASTSRAAHWLFHQVTVKEYAWTPGAGGRGSENDLAAARRYLARFGGALDVAGKTALDVGTGNAQLCFELVRRGATRVVGADIGGEKARRNLARESAEVKARVEIVKTDGTLRELGDEKFDLVFSKDSFEHFAEPEAVVDAMVGALRPGGRLVIGFGP